VAESTDPQRAAEKAQRRAAREAVAAYHQEELRVLLDHVRAGFARLDAGEIDEFDLDELIHRYKKAAARLWSFCGTSAAHWQQAANMIQGASDRSGSPRNWWVEAEPRER
jgi:hypothetical protein